MSGVGGTSGPGSPGGARAPAAASDLDEADGAGDLDATRDVAATEARGLAAADRAAGDLRVLAADIAAGKLTAREAVDRLVDDLVAARALDATDRSDLRALLTSLLANDPYLASLLDRA